MNEDLASCLLMAQRGANLKEAWEACGSPGTWGNVLRYHKARQTDVAAAASSDEPPSKKQKGSSSGPVEPTRVLLPHLHQRVQKKVLLGTSPARVLTCCYLGDGATAELTEALLDRALTASVWRRAAPQHQVGACSQRPRVGATSCATRAALERFTHSRRIDSPQP